MTVILVKKRSTWEQYHANRDAFGAIESASLRRIKDSHDRHSKSVEIVLKALQELKISPWVVDGAETSFKAAPKDLVLALGGDGTFLSASHCIGPQTLIMGINSDPLYSRGRFCSILGHPLKCRRAIKKALTRPKVIRVSRMEVWLGDRLMAKRVLNEALYSHTCPAAMTRVSFGEHRYACSGLWIGTGAGSTGAIKSAGGKLLPLQSKYLQTIIREPCGDGYETNFLSFVKTAFSFIGRTPDATLYLDGPFLRVPVGCDQVMRFHHSTEPLSMVSHGIR